MATNQDFAYPSSADVTITGIGNPTGQPVPADAVYVGGKNPSGNLQGATVDANGALLVSPLTTSSTVTVVQPTGTNLHAVIDSSALPTGASTSALQTTGNTSLATIATNTTGASTSANQTNGTQVSQITPVKGTLTDNSGSTSATPSTSTQIMAANSSRKYLLIENLSTTVNIYINFTSAATAGSGSYLLLPGGSIVQETGFVSTEAVTVLSTTASVPYTAKQA